MPTVNERVVYRAIAGDCWDATVLAVREHPPNTVDLSVMGPGLRKPVELHAIRWSDDPLGQNACYARPRRESS